MAPRASRQRSRSVDDVRASEGWSGRRGSNPRPTAWKAVTLPLSYSRLRARPLRPLARSGGQARHAPLDSRSVLPARRDPALDGAVSLPARQLRLRRPVAGLPTGAPSASAPRRAKAGGEGRIRTSEGAGPTDLQSAAFDRFATSPPMPAFPARSHVSAPMPGSAADGWKRGVFVRNCAAREFPGDFVGAGEGI